MPDPYAIDPDTTTRPDHPQAPSRLVHRPLRAVLWVVLVISIAINSLASAGVLPLSVNIAAGAVTGLAVTALIILHLRRR